MMDIQSEIARVMKDIGPFPRIVWEGLEAGLADARLYCEERQKDEPDYRLEATVAATLARSRAKSYLTMIGGLEVEDLQQLEVNNIGLRTRIQSYDIRIWKSPDDRIPYNGARRRARFLGQDYQLPLIHFDDVDEPNLVILWNVDRAFGLKRLILAKPRHAPNRIFEDAGVYWSSELDHAALGIQPQSQPIQAQPLPYKTRRDSAAMRADQSQG